MSKVITLPVTSFTSHEKIAKDLNELIEHKFILGVFFNKTSLTKGLYEIYVKEEEEQIVDTEILIQHIERPSKFKANSSSKYYCVYKEGNKWRYKFVRKNKVYQSKRFETELEAALMYDNHVYSVDGNTRKLNFPEKVFK